MPGDKSVVAGALLGVFVEQSAIGKSTAIRISRSGSSRYKGPGLLAEEDHLEPAVLCRRRMDRETAQAYRLAEHHTAGASAIHWARESRVVSALFVM